MAKNVTGIAITIKAFLPTGKSVDEQFAALSVVKEAHETGDYSKVLTSAMIDEVKSEQKTRRIADDPAPTAPEPEPAAEPEKVERAPVLPDPAPKDEDVPEFLKKGSKTKAA